MGPCLKAIFLLSCIISHYYDTPVLNLPYFIFVENGRRA